MATKNSKPPKKTPKTRKNVPVSPATKVGFPKKIEVKEDHLKILRDLNAKEQLARDSISLAYLKVHQLEQQVKKIKKDHIDPQIEEVYRQRKRFSEMGQSFMDFYDLTAKEGFMWQLSLDEGLWILMPRSENKQ